ncbi:hypothetical protein [Magnetofaba australis]|uniref:Uncharacterized protein n=1 Tax=Magnetofaba australis IT-1 TaxID=1434232 RepID=A0A1Y2K0S9_9PROT|nr:hypothetical protein [Magnetofaba australis]OSM00414.1 hypothetical protein MAIT1_00928 [Magnetofaba australis IT-1]
MLENLDPQLVSYGMIAISGLAVLIGFFKIIGHGVSLFLWLALVIGGVFGLNVGLQQQGVTLSGQVTDKMLSALEPGAQLSKSAVQAFCARMTEEADKSDSPTGENK